MNRQTCTLQIRLMKFIKAMLEKIQFKINYIMPSLVFWTNHWGSDLPILSPEIYTKKKFDVAIVIGNGPSTHYIDTSLLSAADIFVVNSFYLHPQLKDINPSFYLLADPILGDFTKPQTTIFWENISEKIENAQFILAHHFKIQDLGKYIESRRINILNSSLEYNFEFFSKKPIDLKYPIHGVQNVVLLAIFAAIGLGYKKIILIGCEHDWLSTLGANTNFKNSHFYKETQGVKFIENLTKPYYWWLNAVNTMFLQYQWVKIYAERNGIQIINATDGGVLDVFERTPLHLAVGEE